MSEHEIRARRLFGMRDPFEKLDEADQAKSDAPKTGKSGRAAKTQDNQDIESIMDSVFAKVTDSQ